MSGLSAQIHCNIDKKYYELAAFTELKNAIRSGDISIVGSKQHKQPYAKYWRDGSTSSSDGVRVKSAVEALNACYNPHYGLEKGEAMNALARAIFFGKYGMFHEKDIQGQLQRATALSIIINAITLWNTIYLSKVVEKLKEKEDVNEDFLKHVFPLGWEHINFIGQYNFDDNSDYDLVDNMRPLKVN